MAESTEIISSCLNLMRRLPPKDIENSLEGLVNLVPQVSDELLQRVDQVYLGVLLCFVSLVGCVCVFAGATQTAVTSSGM